MAGWTTLPDLIHSVSNVSEIEVSKARTVVALEDGLSEDILKSEEQRYSVVLKEEGSHVHRRRDVSVVVEKGLAVGTRGGGGGG